MDAKHPLQLILEAIDYKPQSYSGRGMYGERCLGVVVPGGVGEVTSKVMEALFDEGVNREISGDDMVPDVARSFRRVAWDNMGHDYIVYFPGTPFVEGDDTDDE